MLETALNFDAGNPGSANKTATFVGQSGCLLLKGVQSYHYAMTIFLCQLVVQQLCVNLSRVFVAYHHVTLPDNLNCIVPFADLCWT